MLSTKSLRSMKVGRSVLWVGGLESVCESKSLLLGALRGVLNHQPKPPIKHLGEKVCGIWIRPCILPRLPNGNAKCQKKSHSILMKKVLFVWSI